MIIDSNQNLKDPYSPAFIALIYKLMVHVQKDYTGAKLNMQ